MGASSSSLREDDAQIHGEREDAVSETGVGSVRVRKQKWERKADVEREECEKGFPLFVKS